MRWVVLTDDHPPAVGGVARFTASTADALRDAGHEVTVYARARPGLVGALPVHGPSYARRGGLWAGVRALPELARADAVLATTWPLATTTARWHPAVHVVAHGSDVTRAALRPTALGPTWRRAAGRWAVSGFLVSVLGRHNIAAQVLPMPITPAAPRRIRGSMGTLGLIARATSLKGGDRFVRLVRALGARGLVIGEGPALSEWVALAQRLGADVSFLGRRSHAHVLAALAAMDAVVLVPRPAPDGSGAEGLGLALLEAAGASVPVIGCAVGGVPEALGPGLLLTDPDDPTRSASQVRGWWTPDRGAEARAWLVATHGPGRTVAALCGVR
ncbi:MAG: glycosyltransferase involved in cell wall biosynthesis [Myxococcota bacterium]|jgi:glycosyltransferase involved in cell wall biosynthesis